MRFPVFSMIFGASLLLTTVLSAEEATRKIVVFKNGVSEATKITALENFGAKVVKIKDIPFINAVVVNMAQDSEMSLSANTAVEFVETDYYENWLEAVGEDDLREFQTTIQEPQVLPWGVNRIDAEKAWRKTAGRQIRIAVVDTGCGPHPDLRIWGGASVVSYTESYSDDHYHGTHVAGIIAAIDNEFGVVGVAPRVRLYAVKVLNGFGSGFVSDVIEGLQWCVRNKMNAINMSIGTYMNYQTMKLTVEAVNRAGIVQVAAAGNSGGEQVIYPAAYPPCLAISATNKDNEIAYFSSTGPEVDFSAPGQYVFSTIRRNRIPGYGILSGTSMATPHVTGTAALIITMPDPNGDGVWSPAEVRERLKKTATDLGDEGKDNLFGYGLIDAQRAVR
ncbi:MAG: hypothetical protein A2736_00140 [Candidatus Yanofskybacteria bacterium RIFCSPHIGHO2_01_FULL_41_27]|uniref:Peptidase S8/S53 domain-containing protein n=4 Tax=Parcubacteria group TaxID=1794811 RepID=A0A1F8HUJ2_9BACT|nr:MAG: hypothetical protein UU84_C0001G0024 [Candidatus Yanofskybacteria bacterium GW2011_GWC2_41_9]OGM98732.1 MAG: hypothetical protein A2736_00140 [Candidatus Yanofskybacteria bacterium RIFCSPHIGHO2_01_FULL_41_27]OGN21816.1 MAG: hypothetical protein A3B00_01905 [Candidatus Yanofskybacteria bacterium RIFCSPLOWO2_01_FULL_41_33]OGN41172.1 MAG: hypothetical protein A2606_03865 [Candidatus Yanofskybacteria bacterium RIFOXYD1_FULL_42_10]